MINNIGLLMLGTAVGGAISYFYFQNINKDLKTALDKLEKDRLEVDGKRSNRLEDAEGELHLKEKELKKTRREKEIAEENADDLKEEILKNKRANQFLKEENGRLVSSIREYEMLYNSKTEEIEKLKKLVNK